jgi:beta-glucosidase
LEPLEDRCLPSVTTTVPSLADIPPLVAVPDILSATQAKGNPTVVFLGDSISWEYVYGTGAAVWNAYMAPLGMANFGVSGQTTQSLLYQLSLGVLTGINPAEVVLEIGANNLLQGDSPQDTAAGVLADLATIHQFLPQAKVLVLGVFPGMQSPDNPYRSELAQTNQLSRQMLAGDTNATFVDLGSIFLQPDGTISNSMMFDYLHPSTLGYLSLTDALLPVIEQTLFPGVNPVVPNTTASIPNLAALLPNLSTLLPDFSSLFRNITTFLPGGSSFDGSSGLSLRSLLLPSGISETMQPPSPLTSSP